jgi:hypothetical protein
MHSESDRVLHLHLSVFATVNALAVSAWALSGAGGGTWAFWVLILWVAALAVVVARSHDGGVG